MICPTCATASDHGLGRHAHCRDPKCPCQHRPLQGAPRFPLVHAGSLVIISAETGDEK